MTAPGYDGPDRRTAGRGALSAALEDVRDLKGSMDVLAERLPAVASAEQVKRGQDEFRRLLTALVVLFVAQFLSSALFVDHLDHSIRNGHGDLVTEMKVVECELGVAEATRVAAPTQTLITCRQAVEGAKQ